MSVSLNIWLPRTPLVSQLKALTPRARAEEIDRLLGVWLVELIRTGLSRRQVQSPAQLRVQVSTTRLAEVARVAGLLSVSSRRVLQEVILAADEASDRASLELEFRRLRLPGDPTRLSVPVLRLFVENPISEDPLMLAVKALSETVAFLTKRVDVLSSRVESRDVTAAELLKMSPAELRERLRRLGGRAPRNASRGDLLSLIREKENGR